YPVADLCLEDDRSCGHRHVLALMRHVRLPHALRGWVHMRRPRRSPPTGGHVQRGLRGAPRSRTAMDAWNGLRFSTRQGGIAVASIELVASFANKPNLL